MTAYKYATASLSLTPKGGENPKNQYMELFQETLNQQFYNSSDWWTIEEEDSVGSKTYSDTDVRIVHTINAETGLKLGDDWKTVLFKTTTHPVELGKQYIFDSSTWLTINTEVLKNLTATATIRRCNNTLRWIDEPTGVYYEEPCCIEYMVKEPRDYFTSGSPISTPGGFLHIEMQFNTRTNKINENQRFLFGNPEHWTCYKVIGTGINDFRNVTTYDNTSAKILTLDLVANFVNDELDDIVNGIADVYTNVYTITMNAATAEGATAGTIQLYADVTYNGDSVTRTLTWETSDSEVATVNGNGLVTLAAAGSCTITAGIDGNPVTATCVITVTPTPATNSYVLITPVKNYVLEGRTETYTVYLYEDDVAQADAFTIVCDGSIVPSTSYTFTAIDGNHFSVLNTLRCLTGYLTVTCTAGANIKTFDIYLRGAWQYDTA